MQSTRGARCVPWLRISVLSGALLAGCGLAQAGADPLPPDRTPTTDVATGTMTEAIRRMVTNVVIPDLRMVRQDGVPVSLAQELNDGRPVVLNFVYTSCTTICPMSSQEFSLLQQRLGKDRDRVHLVSISIDPEQDTPSRLRTYAHQFHAGKEWNYYTGSAEASQRAQIAFGIYHGDKMSHVPVTLLRTAPGSQWVRLDGFATADDMYAELQGMLARR